MTNSSQQPLFQKTLIIGLGLIGGSFARSLKEKNLSQEICAFDVSTESIDLALDEKIISKSISDLTTISDEKFDLIVISSPLKTYKEIFLKLAKINDSNAIIIDLGSLKSFISKILPKNLEENFIPCHPIAGSEKNGFENSDAAIFQNKKFLICSNAKNNSASVKKVSDLAQKIGFVVEEIEAKSHDDIYALVSHLPQFLSFLLKEFSPKKIEDSFFKKTFRLENSDPEIWSDIFKINEANIEKYYLEFFDNLERNIENIVEKNQLSEALEASKSLAPNQDSTPEFDIDFFGKNFDIIFFRALVALSLLQVEAVAKYRNFAATGFNDFVSVITTLQINSEKLAQLMNDNRSKILKIFKSLS